jgi:hypothetical protein
MNGSSGTAGRRVVSRSAQHINRLAVRASLHARHRQDAQSAQKKTSVSIGVSKMVSRQMKMPVKDDSAKEEAEEVFSQRKRPETGRYLLKVDRQTKSSYKTSEAAQSAAMTIKTAYPVVHVEIYDTVTNSHTLIGPPTASS